MLEVRGNEIALRKLSGAICAIAHLKGNTPPRLSPEANRL